MKGIVITVVNSKEFTKERHCLLSQRQRQRKREELEMLAVGVATCELSNANAALKFRAKKNANGCMHTLYHAGAWDPRTNCDDTARGIIFRSSPVSTLFPWRLPSGTASLGGTFLSPGTIPSS